MDAPGTSASGKSPEVRGADLLEFVDKIAQGFVLKIE
jgi:hypothetical protein